MDKPMNVWSGSKGIGGALTNMTELAFRKGSIVNHYPVEYEGVVYPDAEAAYQKLKTQPRHLDLMARIIATKLRQHPRLFDEIMARGGVAWLETCEHRTWARSQSAQWWEGKGRESPMIQALILGLGIILSH